MDREVIRADLENIVRPYLSRGVSKYEYRFVESIPDPCSIGIRLDPRPFSGRVIAVTPDAIVVKTGRIRFDVVDRAMATLTPNVGDRVEVVPYARHRFDGNRIDMLTVVDGDVSDTLTSASCRIIVGDYITHLPIAAKRSSYLGELIRQIEHLPAPDGFRTIAQLLVDARATAFSIADPNDDQACEISPALHFCVATRKFAGLVSLLYDYQRDYYIIELRKDDVLVERVLDIGFDQIGDILEEKFDDGRWRLIHIHIQERGYGATIAS